MFQIKRKIIVYFIFLVFCFVSANSQNDNQYTELVEKLNTVLTNKYLTGARYGIAISSLTNNKIVYQNNAEKLVTPASTTKLFTTFTALNVFPLGYRIPTKVFTDGIIKGDILQGNIYLVGYGDAYLKVGDLEILAEGVSHLGIKRINGNIYGVGSYYDNVQNRMIYSGDADEVEPLSPVSALSLERNQVTVLVKSSSTPGSKADVQIIPHCEAFVKNVNATVRVPKPKKVKSRKKSRADIILEDEDDYSLRAGDYRIQKVSSLKSQIPLKVNSSSNNGKQFFNVNGVVEPNKTQYYKYHNYLPELTTASVLRQRLAACGIKITGITSTKRINLQTDSMTSYKLLSEVSNPMSDIIIELNKESDNYLAENIFKMIGGHAGNNINTAEGARNKEIEVFKENNIPFEDCVINDGCGLSRRNLVTANSILALLSVSYKKEYFQEFLSSMAIAGVDGTLYKRFKGTPAYNNLRAKTGTLRNTSGLAGYVKSQSGELFAFAFVFNGPSVGLYKTIENELGIILASYNNAKVIQTVPKINE